MFGSFSSPFPTADYCPLGHVGDTGGSGPEQPTWLADNAGGAWRPGGTVHRPAGSWTPAVHTLLGFLYPRLDHIPEVLGIDEQGREFLTFLPGRVVDADTEVLTPGQIDSLISWTRRFHEVVARFGHPGPWRYPHMPHRPSSATTTSPRTTSASTATMWPGYSTGISPGQ
jgi:hypothetical protein